MSYQMPPPPLPGQHQHPPAPPAPLAGIGQQPYGAVVGCRNCGGPLRSKPMKRSGPLKHKGLFLLAALCCGLGLLAWPIWPRKQEQTGVLYTCTVCGLQQT